MSQSASRIFLGFNLAIVYHVAGLSFVPAFINRPPSRMI
jgi:hypothetical protein